MRLSFFIFALSFSINSFVVAQSSTSFSTLLSNDDPQIHFVATIGDVFGSTLSDNQNAISQGYLQKEIDYIISVPETDIPDFKMYPNPTTGKIYLSNDLKPGKSLNIEQIEIYDYSGRLIYISGYLGAITTLPEIDLSTYDSGIYMIHIYFNQKKQTVRIAKI